ncbi:MAG: HlyC/CorC family transporter [Magnetococcales bacterium]|nr:HlyC/CorC family transporter [Magnetococcales bacterium]
MQDALILLVMLILSGLFSGSETALTSVSMIRVEALLKEGRTGAKALMLLKSNTNRMLIAILIGNNLVNIGASAMTTVLATKWFGDIGPGIAVGGLTLAILVFGEITPKTFAARYATPFSLFLAPLLLWFTRLVLPLVWVLERFTVWVQSLATAETEPTVTESELITMAQHGANEGTIDHDEQEMIKRIFAFGDLTAGDIMVPRNKVFIMDGRRTVKESANEILSQPYTRIPLHEGQTDTVCRVVYVREITAALANDMGDKTLSEVGHDPLFVPANKPLDILFRMARVKKKRLINVVDAYGTLMGLLTLEDMLEELVGDIHDELDKPKSDRIQETSPGLVLVDGATELKELADHFEMELQGRPSDPVSLWVLNHIARIPKVGESFQLEGLKVVIARASKRRIIQVQACRDCDPAQEVGDQDDSQGNDQGDNQNDLAEEPTPKAETQTA